MHEFMCVCVCVRARACVDTHIYHKRVTTKCLTSGSDSAICFSCMILGMLGRGAPEVPIVVVFCK